MTSAAQVVSPPPSLSERFASWRTRKPRALDPKVVSLRAWLKAHPRYAWKHGVLWYKLDDNQLRAYWKIRRALGTPFSRFTLRWARRTGKTYLLLLIAAEECIRHKRHRYNIAAATKESLREFVWPALEAILEDCPLDLRPHLQEQRGRVTFKQTKSVMVLAGCNDSRSVERLRGPYSHGNIIEEMGAMPDRPGLRYILVSILNPQLMTTGGWTLQATTPPRSSGHAAARIVLLAEANGTADYCTLFDNPRLSAELVVQYLESDASALGLTLLEYLETPDFRREWLALIETDPTFAVLPAFTPERRAKLIREAASSPLFADLYVSMDIGFSPHWTALLYARWTFQTQRLRIVGERLIRRMGTPELNAAISEDEARLFGEKHKPFLRVADNNNPILLHDLANIYGLVFTETAKDNLRAAVADVNRWIADGTLEIDPACVQLIAQMTAATWDAKGKEFEESEEFGHFDAVASLVYLVRNVIPHINRMPRHYGLSQDHHEFPTVNQPAPEDSALQSVFGGE